MTPAAGTSDGAVSSGALMLCPCPPARWHLLAGLRQHPGQYSADGAVIAADPTPGITLHEIRWGGALVGCFKLDPLYYQRHDFARHDSVGVRGVLIDTRAQGRGIGSAAMALLPAYVSRHHPGAREVVLTVNLKNPAARKVYLRAGFGDAGELYLGGRRGPQHVLRHPLGV